RWLDKMVPDYSGRYQRDRILFSVLRFYTGHWSRNYFLAIPGADHLRALFQATRRNLARDLRRRRGDLPVFQSFRFGGAIIREDSGSPRSRTPPNRTAIQT